jgi:hypothetical protein
VPPLGETPLLSNSSDPGGAASQQQQNLDSQSADQAAVVTDNEARLSNDASSSLGSLTTEAALLVTIVVVSVLMAGLACCVFRRHRRRSKMRGLARLPASDQGAIGYEVSLDAETPRAEVIRQVFHTEAAAPASSSETPPDDTFRSKLSQPAGVHHSTKDGVPTTQRRDAVCQESTPDTISQPLCGGAVESLESHRSSVYGAAESSASHRSSDHAGEVDQSNDAYGNPYYSDEYSGDDQDEGEGTRRCNSQEEPNTQRSQESVFSLNDVATLAARLGNAVTNASPRTQMFNVSSATLDDTQRLLETPISSRRSSKKHSSTTVPSLKLGGEQDVTATEQTAGEEGASNRDAADAACVAQTESSPPSASSSKVGDADASRKSTCRSGRNSMIPTAERLPSPSTGVGKAENNDPKPRPAAFQQKSALPFVYGGKNNSIVEDSPESSRSDKQTESATAAADDGQEQDKLEACGVFPIRETDERTSSHTEGSTPRATVLRSPRGLVAQATSSRGTLRRPVDDKLVSC